MSVVATVEIPAREFTLSAMLAANPDTEVRLVRVVPLGTTFVPYVRASGGSVDAIERALRAEADVESFRVVDRENDETLVRVEWAENVGGLLGAIVETGTSILRGVGSGETWTFRLRFDDQETLTAFHRECRERGVTLDVLRVRSRGPDGDGSALTDVQRETLRLAVERGYFEVPRQTSLVDLAAELGVSDTAVSQRLQRGLAGILHETEHLYLGGDRRD